MLTSDKAITQIAQSVNDAKARLGHERFQVLSWPQSWSSTSCGFGGIAGQAFTDAQTVIVSGDDEAVLVFHNGRFAYEVKSPTGQFWIDCGRRKLPGAKDWPRVSPRFDSVAPAPKSEVKP